MKGKKTGGRQAGTPNKKTLARLATVRQALDEGVSPLDVMLRAMQHYFQLWTDPPPDQSSLETMKAAELAIQAAKDCAPYIHPRLQATELRAEISTPTELSKVEFLRRVIFLAREAKEIEQRKRAPLLTDQADMKRAN